MSSRSNSPNGVAPSSNEKRSYKLGSKFPTEERLWWYELCFLKAREIVSSRPGDSAEQWNEAFKASMPDLRGDHAKTCRYSPTLYSPRRYTKEWQAGACSKMPVNLMWLVIADEIKSEAEGASKGIHISLRERFRDELQVGLTKGRLYDIIQGMREKDMDICHEDYGTAEGSTVKYRKGNAQDYHMRQEALFLRQRFVGVGWARPQTSDEDSATTADSKDTANFDDDSDEDTITAKGLSSAISQIKSAINAVAEKEHKDTHPVPTPLATYQNSINYGMANSISTFFMFGHTISRFDFGHKMPPYDDNAEYHQCLALCISAVSYTPVEEVRAQMKACSMAFCSDANRDFEDMHKSQQNVCKAMGQTNAMADIDAFIHYTLPCVAGREFVVVSHNEGEGTPEDARFIIDCYTKINGAIADDAILLSLLHGHFTLLRLPERTFTSAKNFVDVMTLQHQVHCTFSTIKTTPPPGIGTNTNDAALSTPVNQVKQEPAFGSGATPTPPRTMDSYGFSCDSVDPKRGRSGSGDGTATSPAEIVDSDDNNSGDNGGCSKKLFSATGRGPVKQHPLLDAEGATKYNQKTSYMNTLCSQMSQSEVGPHMEANSKVVNAKDKQAELEEKGERAARNSKSYLAGKKPKNLVEKGVLFTQLCKGM